MSHSSFLSQLRLESREMLSISIPLVSSQLIYSLSGFIGTAMVAQLGEEALAASVLVSMVWLSLSVLFFGALNSVSVLVAHQYGAEDNEAISRIMGQSFILGVAVSLLMILILSSMPYLLRFSAQSEPVLQIANQYMDALLWTVPSLILLLICEQFLAGINRTKIVLRISMLVVPIEIPLIYFLIFGKFGLPKCGVAGVGYGFAMTYTLTAIGLIIYFLKSKYYHRFNLFSKINTIDFKYLNELIRIGLPIGLMHLIEVSAFALATFWIGQFGTTLLAAHQIVMQYLGFVITLVFSISQAVTVRIGHALGSKNHSTLCYSIIVGSLLGFVCVVIIAISFHLVPQFFLRVDIDITKESNTFLVKDASALLSICGILLLFDNFRLIYFGALRGLKDTKFPMYVSLLSFWVIGLSCAFLFGFTLSFRGVGIWWGLTLGIASGAIILFCRLRYLLPKYKDYHHDQKIIA